MEFREPTQEEIEHWDMWGNTDMTRTMAKVLCYQSQMQRHMSRYVAAQQAALDARIAGIQGIAEARNIYNGGEDNDPLVNIYKVDVVHMGGDVAPFHLLLPSIYDELQEYGILRITASTLRELQRNARWQLEHIRENADEMDIQRWRDIVAGNLPQWVQVVED
jgi:hypothetical protein